VVTPEDAFQINVICGLVPLQLGFALVSVKAPGKAANAVDALRRLPKKIARESASDLALELSVVHIESAPIESRTLPDAVDVNWPRSSFRMCASFVCLRRLVGSRVPLSLLHPS
jgi:hypothetical protein